MNTLNELEAWFASQCDGDWEHCEGIRIETLDNPGWMVTIPLRDTNLEARSFDTIREEHGSTWLSARREGDTWWAACDPLSLERAIALFLRWVRQGPREPHM